MKQKQTKKYIFSIYHVSERGFITAHLRKKKLKILTLTLHALISFSDYLFNCAVATSIGHL